MKWFLALLLALNLFVAGVSLLRQHDPVDIHATEVDASKLKVLPPDWLPDGASSAPIASAPLSASAPAAAAASAPVSRAASAPIARANPAMPAKKPTASAPAGKAKPAVREHKPAHAALASAPAAKALQCAQWGELSDSLLTRVQGGLPALKLSGDQLMQQKVATGEASGPGVRYWVYYPAGGAAGLSAELKGKGFDNYVVQNAGEFKGTLSLGLFGKRDGAEALLGKLKAAGYSKAMLLARGKGGNDKTRLVFKSLDDAQLAAITALQKRLTPGIVLKTVPCSGK
jgi:hypothetical protein